MSVTDSSRFAAPVSQEFTAPDGVTLTADTWGDPANPAVIFAHGGGQTRHSWGGTARALAELGWYTIAYDHRGHGDSGWSEDGVYTVDGFAKDLQVIANSCKHPPAVVGASLGGFSAMVCEGEYAPGTFSSITLVDVTPRLNHEGVQNIFTFMTAHIEEGFESLDHAAEVIAKYTGRAKRKDNGGLEKNLRLRDGRWFWHWDPDFFTLQTDRSANPDKIVDAAKNLTLPVLLIRGRMSDVVTQTEVDDYFKTIPHGEYVDVAQARHMVAGDRNDIFTDAVVEFLSKERGAQTVA